jgi:biotin operon repressor
MAESTRKPLVLCNGEPSAVVGQYYGIAACCITASGETELPQTLLDELKRSWSGEIIVALDCDSKGKQATPKLVRQLMSEGFNAWGVNLGGSYGFDLADFCRLWQGEAWEKLPSLPPIEGVRLGKSGRDLMLKEFPPTAWVVPWILPEGLSICAAKPKMGKSWLWLNVCLSVSFGGFVLGKIKVPHCNALYLCLEDGERRLQNRIRELGYDHKTIPADFEYDDTLPALDNGAITLIDDWIKSKKRTSNRYNLVVIDTLVMVKKAQKRGINIYDQDYDGLSDLRAMGQKHPGTAILLIHHTKKGDASDVYDMMTGSTGLQGVVETEMVLFMVANQAWLQVTGKDVEETKIPLRFDKETCQWIALEDQKVQISPERTEIIDYLTEVGEARPKEIAEALGIPYNNVLQLAKGMKDEGIVVAPKRGVYKLAIHDLMIDHERISSDDQQPDKSFMIDHEIMNSPLLDVPQTKTTHMYGRGD